MRPCVNAFFVPYAAGTLSPADAQGNFKTRFISLFLQP